mmetsp:Transcript_15981/g.18540  ORF Transcript_15981/g.18540 Transcript_15981/m.18540 type:complete len:208 (-) Transcript_15981:945-1568(-)
MILASRYIFINEEELNIDKPPKTAEHFDLRDSDFNPDGTIISIEEALERYREEALINKEAEECRLQEEEERKRKEQEELEAQNEQSPDKNSDSKRSQPNEQSSNQENEDENKHFMSEQSFLAKLQDMKNSAVNLKVPGKKQYKVSPRDCESSGKSEENDLPEMNKLNVKHKSVKVNAQTEADMDLDSDRVPGGSRRKHSQKRKLKIK